MSSTLGSAGDAPLHVGIYVGLTGEPTSNIESALAAWGRFLNDVPWQVETFGSADPPAGATKWFPHVSTMHRSYRTPIDKILAVTNDCREYIDAESPDLLLQFWQTQTNAPGVILAGHLTDTPVAARLVGDIFREYTDFDGIERYAVYLLANILCATSLQYADHVIGLGPYGKSELVRHGVNPGSVSLLPPTLPPNSKFQAVSNRTKCRRELGLPTDRCIAFYAGRLTNHKGMDFLKEVIKATSDRSDVMFLLAGQGPFHEQFSARHDDSVVQCLGYVDHDYIHKYYQVADVYVHPSKYEGIPLSILEAIQCGLPVVARDAGDIALTTENLVQTPSEMATLLASGLWSESLPDRTMFEPEYQKRVLRDLIQDVI